MVYMGCKTATNPWVIQMFWMDHITQKILISCSDLHLSYLIFPWTIAIMHCTLSLGLNQEGVGLTKLHYCNHARADNYLWFPLCKGAACPAFFWDLMVDLLMRWKIPSRFRKNRLVKQCERERDMNKRAIIGFLRAGA